MKTLIDSSNLGTFEQVKNISFVSFFKNYGKEYYVEGNTLAERAEYYDKETDKPLGYRRMDMNNIEHFYLTRDRHESTDRRRHPVL